MKNKKEQELLREIVPVLIKYDLATIENCVNYMMENKQQLANLLAFVNGDKFETQNNRDKSEIDEILLTTEKEKSVIIKRIFKYLSGKRFTFEQIRSMCVQYFKDKQVFTNLKMNNKNEILLEVTRILATLTLEEIKEFECYMQINKKTEAENTLENWSKVIVK